AAFALLSSLEKAIGEPGVTFHVTGSQKVTLGVVNMKRTVAVASVALILLAPFLWTVDAWARAGRGGSSGSRGSPSYSAPARPSANPASPGTSDVATTPDHSPATAPAGSGWGGAVGGLIAGGLLGSLLFGGGGGGFGFTDLVAFGLLAFLLI